MAASRQPPLPSQVEGDLYEYADHRGHMALSGRVGDAVVNVFVLRTEYDR